jgi:hypothetical protein
MSYRFYYRETMLENVQRVAFEQNEAAIAEIDDRKLDVHETVHQARKHCKKIRGLIRLVRPQFKKTYKFENAWYRDAARDLSSIRDAQSMIEIYDSIISRH